MFSSMTWEITNLHKCSKTEMSILLFLIHTSLVHLSQGIVFPFETPDGSGRVVGGSATDMEGWQFIASIQEVNDPLCVGLLLSPKNTLTTCQCIYEILRGSIEYTSVVAGTVRRDRSLGMWRPVSKVITHPHCSNESIYFNLSGNTFDYGIVQVNKTFEFKPGGILRARFPTKNFDKFEELILRGLDDKTRCKVAGWGATVITFPEKYQAPSTVLLSTEVELQDWEPCAETMCTAVQPHCYSAVLLTGKLCAKSIGKGNPCQDDLGGPLVCNGYIIAMVSKINSCGEYVEPNYYARIDVALPWILTFSDQKDSARICKTSLITEVVTAIIMVLII